MLLLLIPYRVLAGQWWVWIPYKVQGTGCGFHTRVTGKPVMVVECRCISRSSLVVVATTVASKQACKAWRCNRIEPETINHSLTHLLTLVTAGRKCPKKLTGCDGNNNCISSKPPSPKLTLCRPGRAQQSPLCYLILQLTQGSKIKVQRSKIKDQGQVRPGKAPLLYFMETQRCAANGVLTNVHQLHFCCRQSWVRLKTTRRGVNF